MSRSRSRIASTRLRGGRRQEGSRFGIRGALSAWPVLRPRSASASALSLGTAIARLLGSGIAGEDILAGRMSEDADTGIRTGSVAVDGISVFYRRMPGEGPPAVFVHGVPTHSEDFDPFLRRITGPGVAIDMPGFGRSDRPPPDRFAYTMEAYAGFIPRVLDALGIGEHSLVVHDWGAVGLVAAQRDPSRVRSLCVINAVPLLPGYRWHRTARIWRTPVLGELSTRGFTRRSAALALRESRADWSAMPGEFLDMVWNQLDRGTFRAILRLYRSAPEELLARLGEGLGAIGAPALVVWGLRDRYIPGRFGRAYSEALGGAELMELPDAGHWPWMERADVVDRVAAFVDAR